MDARFSCNLSCCTMCLRCVFLIENKVIDCIDIRFSSNCSWPSAIRLWRCCFFQTLRKFIYSGFLPAFSGQFTYQSLGTIAFKIIQIFNQNTVHSAPSLLFTLSYHLLWCCRCYGNNSSWFPAFNVILKPS